MCQHCSQQLTAKIFTPKGILCGACYLLLYGRRPTPVPIAPRP